MKTLRWNSRDLELLPEDGKRYEIVDGELYVSKQPHWQHQFVCGEVFALLRDWSRQTKAGMASFAPGLIFADDDDVAPDIVWVSRERLATSLRLDGKLHTAPELVVEVLSPGTANERRDREVKLKLYSRRGVQEYWIVDWRTQQVAVYRLQDGVLQLVVTLAHAEILTSPLLPGFACPVATLFETTP